jgi:ribulose-5-phosphate 4-epimerase/fuculose-1-phosphate aldolase
LVKALRPKQIGPALHELAGWAELREPRATGPRCGHTNDRENREMDTLETTLASRPRHIPPEEWEVRVDLAAAYRLIAHFKWDDLILTHNSARVPGTTDQFLINPMGLMFDEITASNLIKIDVDGNQVEPSEYEPNYAGFVIHSAIYMGRSDVNCVIHTHTEADIAVGALDEGLLPLSQWAMRFYNRLGYHDYEGVSLDLDERERLQQSIGQHPVLVLRNHGLLVTGRNVAEAFSYTYHFERSAEAQLKIQAAAAAGGKIVTPPVETCERQAALFANSGNTPRLGGQREWPALLRVVEKLDPGFRA